MTAPINTYNSDTDLALGQVPQVDDPALYQDLLDIHNALEILLTSSDNGGGAFLEFLAKFRGAKSVSGDYEVSIQDGTILVDASTESAVITLPLSAEGVGYRYDVKVVAWQLPYEVTVVGSDSELIDDHASGVRVDYLSSYTFKSKTTADNPLGLGYAII